MQIETHNLQHEFPEYVGIIQRLKGRDIHFTKLLTTYDKLDEDIRNLELAGLPISDSEIEGMKLQRVHLKDSLYSYLKQAK